ncbi:MAG TPA: tRNA (adenosine(37)-N6)-dimethylallyltransferase MiaA [Fimbriimonadales bacterium]|nr:tRNA (adenosine(37)-N6)-dimethylallyltransferase MiaA [Fimbriimonadales bacterium]
MIQPAAIAIMGPTAVGKSVVAERLASMLDCRIVNADAFQVYRGFDVGTAKPDNRDIYDLIDILSADVCFSAGKFVKLARPLCIGYAAEGRDAVVCGGTGLYVRALFDGYKDMTPADSEQRARLRQILDEFGPDAVLAEAELDPASVKPELRSNPVRVLRLAEKALGETGEAINEPWHAQRFKFALRFDRYQLNQRIEARVLNMVHNGWREEVSRLLAAGAEPHWPPFRAIGYREMCDHLEGDLSLDDAIAKIIVRTRRYAKRQITWLAKERGLVWLDGDASAESIARRIADLIREEKDG